MAHVANDHLAFGFLNLPNCHGEKAKSSSQNPYVLQTEAVPAITVVLSADSATKAPRQSAVDVPHRKTLPEVQARARPRALAGAIPTNPVHEKSKLPHESVEAVPASSQVEG